MIAARMAHFDPWRPPKEKEQKVAKKTVKEKIEQKANPVQKEKKERANTQPPVEVVEEMDVPAEEIEKMEKEAEFLDE